MKARSSTFPRRHSCCRGHGDDLCRFWAKTPPRWFLAGKALSVMTADVVLTGLRGGDAVLFQNADGSTTYAGLLLFFGTNNLALVNDIINGQLQFYTKGADGVSRIRMNLDPAVLQLSVTNTDFHVYRTDLATLLHVGDNDAAELRGENVELHVGTATNARIRGFSGSSEILTVSSDVSSTGSEGMAQGKGFRVEIGNVSTAKFRITNTGFDKFWVDKDECVRRRNL